MVHWPMYVPWTVWADTVIGYIDISESIILPVDATDAAPVCKTNSVSIQLLTITTPSMFRKVHSVSGAGRKKYVLALVTG